MQCDNDVDKDVNISLNSTKCTRCIILRRMLGQISFHPQFVVFDSTEGMHTKSA